MTDFEDRFIARPGRTSFGVGMKTLVVLGGLTLAGGLLFGGVSILLSPVQIAQKTFNADNVIYNYEWFRQQYQDIQAMDAKIGVQEAAALAATGDEKVRVTSIVSGLKVKRAQMVADYNARGSMANRSIFTAGLPQQIQ